jgi:hypothetical protein
LVGHVVSYRPDQIRTVATPSLPEAGSLLTEAQATVNSATSNLQVFSSTVAGLRARQTTIANRINDVGTLRQRLMVALRQAQYEGRWPLNVSGYRFYQAAEAQDAINKTETYLQKATQDQAEILHENVELDKTQRRAEWILESMKRVYDHMLHTQSSMGLENDSRQLQTLGLNLQNTISELQKIDAGRVDMRPFSLAY